MLTRSDYNMAADDVHECGDSGGFGYARHPAKSRQGMWMKRRECYLDCSGEVGARGFICRNLGADRPRDLKCIPFYEEKSAEFHIATNLLIPHLFALFVRRSLWWTL